MNGPKPQLLDSIFQLIIGTQVVNKMSGLMRAPSILTSEHKNLSRYFIV